MTPDSFETIIKDAETNMKKAIAHLEGELTKVRAGKASAGMLDGITVDYYGAPTPISQVGAISTPDARTITINIWEKNMLPLVERAIIASNIGLNPQNDGIMIKLFLPPMTEERRKELVKKSSAECEQGKIAIRNIRRDAIEHAKKLQKEGQSEDAAKDAEKDIQNCTDKSIATIEKVLELKEKDIMSV
jgi:ribosome recycling factor